MTLFDPQADPYFWDWHKADSIVTKMWGQTRRVGWSTNLAIGKMRTNGKNVQFSDIQCMPVTLQSVYMH